MDAAVNVLVVFAIKTVARLQRPVAVEVEKATGVDKDDDTVAAEVSAALKARIGVKPAKVIVHPDGGLDTRSEHKSRRVIDERNIDYSI